MRNKNGFWLVLGSTSVLALISATALIAQEENAAATEDATMAEEAVEDLAFSPEDLDTLMGPIALFPDPLVSQILMATTVPMDVVKADRFLSENEAMETAALETEISAKGWDPSVVTLATGFPSLVTRMAEHPDWTEQAGEAVLAQTDDVLDAIQRLRVEAQENGYLDSNDAQSVVVEGDTITINPANPEVVYVPTYEPEVVYSTQAPVMPYYVSDDDDDLDDALIAGGIFFGSAILLDEIFDDDDDYWHGSHVDWDDDDFGGNRWNGNANIDNNVNIGGGGNNTINIDKGPDLNGNRPNLGGDRPNLGGDRPNLGGDKPNLGGDRPNLGGNRPNLDGDRDRPGTKDRDKVAGKLDDKLGDRDQNQIDRDRDKQFRPSDNSRDDARNKIKDRKEKGDGVATLPAPGRKPGKPAGKPGVRPDKSNKLPSIAPSATRPTAKAPPKINRPTTKAPPKMNKPHGKTPAFKQSGGSRANKASNRGRASSKKLAR